MEEDKRGPEILYGDAANLRHDPLEFTAKFPVASASWKTGDEVEFEGATGTVFVNDDQLLFRCISQRDHSVSIDAECILLHAQSDDQVLYLQLHETPSNSECGETMEFTLTLSSSSDCEHLFRSLSHLVEQHPVYGDDEYDAGHHDTFHSGDMSATMMMGAAGYAYGDHLIVGARPESNDEQLSGEPSEVERNAMLDRLDAMLVVSPEISARTQQAFHQVNGQFDDADDDEIL